MARNFFTTLQTRSLIYCQKSKGIAQVVSIAQGELSTSLKAVIIKT